MTISSTAPDSEERQPATTTPVPAASVSRARGSRRWALWIGRAAAVVVIGWALLPVAGADPKPLDRQPAPDAQEYADAARHLAGGDGYVTTVHGNSRPPRYPPGYSAALAPFARVGHYPANVQRAAKLYVLAWLVVCAAVAWALAGPVAGMLAALILAASPFAHDSARLVMSDALAALLAVVPLTLVGRASGRRALLAGGLAGAAFTLRLSALFALPAVVVALPRQYRLRALAGATPFLLAIGVYQAAAFGSPLRTGYDYWLHMPISQTVSAKYVFQADPITDGPNVISQRGDFGLLRWAPDKDPGGPLANLPNAVVYPAVLLGVPWVYYPPLVGLLGLAYLWRKRRSPIGRYGLVLVLANLAFFLVYFYQGVRFLAPVTAVVAVVAAVQVTELLVGFSHAAMDRARRQEWREKGSSAIT